MDAVLSARPCIFSALRSSLLMTSAALSVIKSLATMYITWLLINVKFGLHFVVAVGDCSFASADRREHRDLLKVYLTALSKIQSKAVLPAPRQ